MRLVLRIAVVLSVLVVFVAILMVASADSSIDRAFGGVDEDDPFWPLAGAAAQIAAGANLARRLRRLRHRQRREHAPVTASLVALGWHEHEAEVA